MQKRSNLTGNGLAVGLAIRRRVCVAVLGLSALFACGSDAGSEDTGGSVTPAPAAPSDVEPTEGAPASFGRYQFVETPEGMTVETLGADTVQTLSCAVRTCGGLCDECAAAACRAAGELEGACDLLASTCNEMCNCDSGGVGCGFPVCALDRQVCYIGDGLDGIPDQPPGGPGPDPAPDGQGPQLDPASSPSGRGASQPAPVP